MAEQNKSQNNNPKKKKSGFKKFLIFIMIIAFIWWFNNFTIKITETEVHSNKIVSPVKIAVISDYHAEKVGISPDTVLKKLEKIAPDAVFYLGDMYSRDAVQEEMNIAIELMTDTVNAGFTVFFVPGEHDTSLKYLNILMQNGINVMNYQSAGINLNGNNIKIYGIDNVFFSETFDLSTEFALDENYYNILLAHIPMYEYYQNFGADLTLCGDTHGGIIQLPFNKGPVYYNATDEWLPELKEQRNDIYDKGLFKIDDNYKYMFITSGLGNSPVPARLNNRPEIAVIDLLPT